MSPQLRSTIRVLIVEDSPLMQQLLNHIFGQDPAFQVIATADCAASALEAINEFAPDVVTMDIQIKRGNGLDLTRQIMQNTPVPIVVISTSCLPDDARIALEIVQAGALAAVPKPPAVNHPDFARASGQLRQVVKDMSQVKVVKRRPAAGGGSSLSNLPLIPRPATQARLYSILVIGASTGGPPAVLSLLKELSPLIPVPVLLVQHIYPGFAAGLVELISSETPWRVKLLNSDTRAERGIIYLCENGYQMGVKANGTISICKAETESRHCPSVSYLFASTAKAYGSKAIGIILSGMGNDGAHELKVLKEKGAMTIAQDQKSSILYGMPGEAARINAAEYVLSPSAAGRMLNQIFGTITTE